MPKFIGTATWSATGVSINPGIALLGLTMADPMATWPSKGSDITTTVDADNDTKAGVTANSADGNGYAPPPTALSLSPNFADKIYLAIRNAMTLSSPETDCTKTSYSGTADVTAFDNHVVGCHVKGGGECSASEADFVDSNRTIYTVTAATFDTVVIPDGSTCADARNALPAQ
jgi:hypothetical protein